MTRRRARDGEYERREIFLHKLLDGKLFQSIAVSIYEQSYVDRIIEQLKLFSSCHVMSIQRCQCSDYPLSIWSGYYSVLGTQGLSIRVTTVCLSHLLTITCYFWSVPSFKSLN